MRDPIGNLEDMTFRGVRILQEVDLIAAEDTRNSIRLLNHFEIKTPMTSYHEYNKIEKGRKLLEKLQAGTDIARDHRCGYAGNFGSGGGAGEDVPGSRDPGDGCPGSGSLHHGPYDFGSSYQEICF